MPFPPEIVRSRITKDQMILTINWGELGGDITNQTDLVNFVNTKANIAHTHFLNELANVDLYSTQPQDGYIFYFDASSSKWKSKPLPPNVTKLSELTDVDTTTSPPQNGYVLTFLNNKWRPSQVQSGGGANYLRELLDVDLLTIQPQQDNILTYDASQNKWKPSALPAFTGATRLSQLTDVNTTLYPPANNNVLLFDDTLNAWRPGTLSFNVNHLEDIGDVQISNIDYGHVLIWEGSKWINASLGDANIAQKNHTHDATQIVYDNTLSGLQSNNIQAALDELNNNIMIVRNDLTNNIALIYDRFDLTDAQIAANATSISTLNTYVNDNLATLNNAINAINITIDNNTAIINTRIDNEVEILNTRIDGIEADIANIPVVNIIDQNKIYNIPTDFPSIEAALNSINSAVIYPNVYIDILVPAGTYILPSTVNINNPQTSNIHIYGVEPLVKNIVNSSTPIFFDVVPTDPNSYAHWEITFTLDNVTDIIPGQYAVIDDSIITSPDTEDKDVYYGVWLISAVDTTNNTITINHLYNQNTTFPCMNAITGGTIKVYPTVLTCDDTAEFSLFNFITSGSITNILFKGNYSDSAGIFISPNATVDIFNCAVINCGFAGFQCKNGYLNLSNVVASNNYIGILSDINGTIIANDSVITSFNSFGFYSRRKSFLRNESSTSCWNSVGLQTEDNSFILAKDAYVLHNSTTDYYATRTANMYVGVYNTSATFDPEKNTVGNLNSIIITDLF